MDYQSVINKLNNLKDKETARKRAKKYNIKTTNSYGIPNAKLNPIAKQIGHNKNLAFKLYESGIYEGKLLCSKILRPTDVNEELTEKWAKDFDNWEICDSFCMALIAKSDIAINKIKDWHRRESEFEKRAAFATMAAYCMADKKAMNSIFESFIPYIKEAAEDERNFVKKAVSWALRSIGKRNIDLLRISIQAAEELLNNSSDSSKWIARDALRELQNEKVRISDYPRNIYRVN